ncbi:HAD-IIB family hydrolase [Clostridium vincentii]|uniref:Pyridoxal phosphate phosphatase YigL n=1 Tax=Clostridium vincentii TaxID=52704 RepID=A0A2T0BJI5_9CLOT|nr:HAD-IIB family hydrolase [Clostridium vincentii]PRR84055.1 Pyridoxal phosphate phosphatase YigL [Clostridium vincentii]
MPKVGMRIIKSAIVVFICFLIYFIREDGMPFYSAIAGILCMQQYLSNSLKAAGNRTIGTIIGGAFGMLILVIERTFIPEGMPIVEYFLISIAIIPLIYLTILIEKQAISYIACVVFLSVTVIHGVDVSPFFFTINRILDTLIGIFVSLGVNSFQFPKKKNPNILFVSDLDDTLLNSKGEISPYSKVKLNQMIRKGAQITISSTRTAATLIPLMKDVDIKLPLITMNGAALYNIKKKIYINCKNINSLVARKVLDIFKQYGLNVFVHSIINDIVHIYYDDFTNSVEEEYYHLVKTLPLKNYIYGELPKNKKIVYFRAIDKEDIIKKLYDELIFLDNDSNLNINYYKDAKNPGYYYLDIYSSEASRKNAILDIKKKLTVDRIVTFGNSERDIDMIKTADNGYIVENAEEKLRAIAINEIEKSTYMPSMGKFNEPNIKFGISLIGSNDTDSVAKTIEKLFYSRIQ